MNFGTPHIFFLYPKKLGYSSRNAYIQKLRVRLLGNASYLPKNQKDAAKNISFFVNSTPFFRIVNSVAAGYHPLTYVYPMIAISAPGCGGIIAGLPNPGDRKI